MRRSTNPLFWPFINFRSTTPPTEKEKEATPTVAQDTSLLSNSHPSSKLVRPEKEKEKENCLSKNNRDKPKEKKMTTPTTTTAAAGELRLDDLSALRGGGLNNHKRKRKLKNNNNNNRNEKKKDDCRQQQQQQQQQSSLRSTRNPLLLVVDDSSPCSPPSSGSEDSSSFEPADESGTETEMQGEEGGEEVVVANKGAMLLVELPEELVVRLLCFVSFKEVPAVMATCRLFYNLCSENIFWRAMVDKKWPKNSAERGVISSKRHLRLTQRNMQICWYSYLREKSDMAKKGAFKVTCLPKFGRHVPKPRFIHTGCALDGKIYYIGGQTSTIEERLNEIYCFDIATQLFDRIEVTNGRVPNFARHTAVAIDRKIYTFGGYDGHSSFFNLCIYDIDTNTWTTNAKATGDLPTGRSNHSAAAIGTKMYIFGGSNDNPQNVYTILGDFYELETTTMTWTRLDTKKLTNHNSNRWHGGSGSEFDRSGVSGPTPRVGHRMVALGNRLYLFGGGQWSFEQGWTEKLNELWIFDTNTNEWQKADAKGDLPKVCSYPFIFGRGHHLYLFGGQSTTTSTVTNHFYSFDTVTQVWTEIKEDRIEGALPGARDMGAANVVGNSAYMFGGYCGGPLAPPNVDFWKIDFSKIFHADECK